MKFDDVFFSQFWPGFFSTTLGGISLTLIYFLFKEKFFSLPVIAGVWECETTTLDTKYNGHRGMTIWYRVTLLQSGATITGMGEKEREDARDGKREYEGKHRRTTHINGAINKKFFGSDEVVIFWRENGQERESGSYFRLRVSGCKAKGDLWGRFYASASKSSGTASWKRIA